MGFFTQFLGGLSLILACALVFGETVSGSEFMGRPALQRLAVLFVMLVGVLAGIMALAIALGFIGSAATGLFGSDGVLVRALGIGVALLMLTGAVLARKKLALAGLLLMVGAFGALVVFGFTRLSGVAIALAAIAGTSALVMVDGRRAPPELRGHPRA